MKKLVLFLVVALLLPVVSTPASAPARAEGGSITVFNWYDYIDESVIQKFEEETGIQVKYTNFTTNEEMYAKLKNSNGAYDVIFPSDYIIERMIREDMLEKLDPAAIPNAAGVIDTLKNPDYDPTGEYSVPYMWGTVGILYNTDLVDEDITSWQSLFNGKYKVFMLDSIRDTIAVALKTLGYSMNTRDITELNAARDLLIKQKNDGIVKGYLVDETKDKMIAGEAPLALMWSGDAMYAITQNPSLKYVIPEEGSNVWVDAMCIPKGSQNKEAAEKFIDFLCRPDIAYKNLEYIYYSTPIQAVHDMLTEEELGYEALNPSPESLARCEFFHDISGDMALYDKIWMEIRS